MSASIEQGEDGIVSIKGELTFDSVTALLVESKKLLSQQTEINIELSQVTHANSAGLALLLEWLSLEKNSGQKVKFTAIPEALISIANLYNVGKLIV